MRSFRPVVLTLLLLGPGFSAAQTEPKAEPAKAEPAKANSEVEVKFGDSSTMRMQILQENVEIVTKFGKLLVPIAEVRKMELGVHLPEGVGDKIQAAMKKLGSDNFKDREEAVSQLVAIGPGAYPSLHLAAKSTDLETSQRAQMGIKRLRTKFTADQLRLTVNDRIVTTEFTIVGRIISPTIKAQTPYFGTVELKLAELRSVLWLSGNMEVEVLVDASKYCHPLTWMETNVNVEGGNGLQITASGDIDLLPGNGPQFMCGPQGNVNIGGRGPGNRLPGMLIGRIGENGSVFNIGERYSGLPSQEGKLYLQIVGGNFGGGNQPAQGTYKVKITAGLDIR